MVTDGADAKIPVGTVNPSRNDRAGELAGTADEGVGSHWWYQVSASDLVGAQLAPTVGGPTKPAPW